MENKDKTIEKYKKQFSVFRSIGIIYMIVLLICFVITILNCSVFNLKAMIACSVFAVSIVVFMLFITIFDIKRNKIIKKYYGVVSEKDRQNAKSLLEKISVLDKNEHDFYDILRCDIEDSVTPQILKLLIKGKKVHIDLYKPIKIIEQEIINNKEKYIDEEFNDFIFELVTLLESNLCDI